MMILLLIELMVTCIPSTDFIWLHENAFYSLSIVADLSFRVYEHIPLSTMIVSEFPSIEIIHAYHWLFHGDFLFWVGSSSRLLIKGSYGQRFDMCWEDIKTVFRSDTGLKIFKHFWATSTMKFGVTWNYVTPWGILGRNEKIFRNFRLRKIHLFKHVYDRSYHFWEKRDCNYRVDWRIKYLIHWTTLPSIKFLPLSKFS